MELDILDNTYLDNMMTYVEVVLAQIIKNYKVILTLEQVKNRLKGKRYI